MILGHSDLRSILNASGDVDRSGFLKCSCISYHDLVRNTTKLNVSVKNQKCFQNVSIHQ